MEKRIMLQLWVDDPVIEKDGEFYTAYNEKLQISACGISKEEAISKLEDTIKTSFKALSEEGVFIETMKKLGIPYKVVSEQKEWSDNLRPILVGV